MPAAGEPAAALARVRAACARLLAALERPPDLLDVALAPDGGPGAVADRIAAAVLPDAAVRQELLETLDVEARLARVADAVEGLVREVTGGRE